MRNGEPKLRSLSWVPFSNPPPPPKQKSATPITFEGD